MQPIPFPSRLVGRVAQTGQDLAKRVRRHPLPIETHFNHSLVVTWAFPPEVLDELLAPGLTLDTYTAPDGQTYGFAAVALVDLDRLRLAGTPERLAGTPLNAHLMAGYRVFATMQTQRGTTMRGLRILHSQSSTPLSTLGANVTTRYHYATVEAEMAAAYDILHASFTSRDGLADVDVTAHLADHELPTESPFADERAARRFAGPLPYTFSSDPDGIVVVKSSRSDWHPTPVRVEVAAATFFDHGVFAGVPRRLANAFHVADLDYGWEAGRLHPTESLVL